MSKKKRQSTEAEIEKDPALEQPEASAEKANGLDELWKVFSSMKLGLVLLLVIAVASVIGTLLPQNPQTGTPTYDIYHSFWYRALLAALCLNLIVCSINRYTFIRRSLGQPRVKVNENFLKKLGNYTVIKERVDEKTACKNLSSALSARGYRVFTEDTEEGTYVAADKGRFGVLGSFIAHLAFVVIALGAMIGNVTGWESYINALEGQTFSLQQDVIRGGGTFFPEQDFKIKVNSFKVTYQKDGWMPKDYVSDLSVFDMNGKLIERKKIEVNSPLRYHGIKFYQSSFGHVIDLNFTDASGKSQVFTVTEGQAVTLPGTGEEITILRYIPNFDPSNPMQTKSQESDNPAVVYKLTKNGQQVDMNYKLFKDALNVDGGTVKFAGRYYTGLSVRKDPGVPVVVFGCIVLVLGTFVSLFLQHRKIWGVVKKHNDMVTVELGGTTEKNKLALENDFNRVVDSLKI